LILQFDTVCTSKVKTKNATLWQRAPVANLISYIPSGVYFARVRIHGKLIMRSLKTTALTVARLRLGDLLKEESRRAEDHAALTVGKMTL
jgi:hypothetical protein